MTVVDLDQMPVAERLRLMETLWESLCARPSSEFDMPAWHGELLGERLRRLASGEDRTAPWLEAKERIRATIKSA